MDVEIDRPEEDRRGVRPGAVAGGTILLVVGGTLLLDQTGVLATPLRQLIGPLVLITLGALIMVEKGGIVYGCRRRGDDGTRRMRVRQRGGAIPGLWLMGLGTWMLISQLHLWGLDFHNSWPLLLILSGVMMLVRGIR
jgi:cell wall-active antibiotic response 4TMS protein YvqF